MAHLRRMKKEELWTTHRQNVNEHRCSLKKKKKKNTHTKKKTKKKKKKKKQRKKSTKPYSFESRKLKKDTLNGISSIRKRKKKKKKKKKKKETLNDKSLKTKRTKTLNGIASKTERPKGNIKWYILEIGMKKGEHQIANLRKKNTKQ